MATFAKLKNGDWGIRVQGDAPEEGTEITVNKKDGSTTIVTVERVLWQGLGNNGVNTVLCAIRQQARQQARRRRFVPCGYPGCSPNYCDECDGAGRYGED